MRPAIEGILDMKSTWEKIFEYASMPLYGTMSRKLHKGMRLQINEGKVVKAAVLFLNDKFVRLTESESDGTVVNTYCDLEKIGFIRTLRPGEKGWTT
jgi:hypothetical protein